MKRLFKIIFSLLIFLLMAMIIVPWLFRDELEEALRQAINETVTTRVDFESVNLSLFRSFPDLQLAVNKLTVMAADTSGNDTLLYANAIRLDLDLFSVFRKSDAVQINAFEIDRPQLDVLINSEGRANYDILVADSSDVDTNSTATYVFSIDQYLIRSADIGYLDMSSGTGIYLRDLNHEGQAYVDDDLVDLTTRTQCSKISFSASDQLYLDEVGCDLNLDLLIDLKKNFYSISKANLNLNELLLNLTGSVTNSGNSIGLDLQFDAPGNEFGELWSILPLNFKKDLNDLKTSGNFKLNGEVKGDLVFESSSYPNMNINLSCSNGYVSHSSFPRDLKGIEGIFQLSHDQGEEAFLLDIERFDFNAGKSSFASRAAINTDDKALSGFVKSNIDLNDLPFEFDASGQVNSDLSFSGNLNDISGRNYSAVDLRGTMALRDLKVAMDGLPRVQVDAPNITVSPKVIRSDQAKVIAGRSDFSGQIELFDPLAIFAPGLAPHIKLKGSSDIIDSDEWLNIQSEGGRNDEAARTVWTNLLPFGITAEADATIGQLNYTNYELKQLQGKVKIYDESIKVDDCRFMYNGQAISGNATFTKIIDYLNEESDLKGNLSVRASSLDISQLMAYDTLAVAQNGSVEEAPFVLPEGFDLDIDLVAGQLLYDKINLQNISGKIGLVDQTLRLTDVQAQTLGGTMKLLGSLKSDGIEPAVFDFKYDVVRLPFEGIYKSVISVQKLAPLAEYLKGIFNSTFVVSGQLDQKMYPDLASIAASGYIETIEGQLAQLPFLGKLSEKLAVKELKNMAIEDTRNWFEIKDGRFNIEPFEYTYSDMLLKVKGSTGLDRTMDLDLEIDIPKEKVDKLPGGASLNRGLDWAQKEVAKLGLTTEEVTSYNFGVDMIGAIRDPDIKIRLLGVGKAQGKEMLNTVKEEVKNKVIDTLQKEKEKLVDKATEEAKKKTEEIGDSLNKRLSEETDKVIEDAKEKIGEKAGNALDSLLDDKTKDVLKEGSDEKIDELKKRLENYNPFKKKK